jgi:hypothetical protein
MHAVVKVRFIAPWLSLPPEGLVRGPDCSG